MMSRIEQLPELPFLEWLQLVEELWDSIAVEPLSIRLREAQMEELDRCVERAERSPDDGVKWVALKGRILRNLKMVRRPHIRIQEG
jgi:putative addiction module component (TIGR02574 family)